MSKEILISKLTSRKFLALVTALIISIGTVANVGDEVIVKIIALVGAFFSIGAYIWGEAYVDGKRAGADVYINEIVEK